jgi:hypothetical protein
MQRHVLTIRNVRENYPLRKADGAILWEERVLLWKEAIRGDDRDIARRRKPVKAMPLELVSDVALQISRGGFSDGPY